MPTYSPGDVSKLLDIPPSTLRRYVAEFGEFLSEEAKRRRSRSFDENDIAVIARIRDLTGQGLKLEEIPPRLVDIAPEDRPQTALDFPGIQKQIESMFDTFKSQQQDINDLRREIEDLKKQQRRSWWDRLLGRD